MLKRKPFSHIGILGLGLIGGSFGLAAKHFFPNTSITGLDKNKQSLKRAQTRGAIDDVARNLADLRHVDLLILAAPIQEILSVIPRLPAIINEKTLVTDTGSTKIEICKLGARYLPGKFVGGHPLAGSERSGMDAAHPFLFQNAIYVLTPSLLQKQQANRLAVFLKGLGAKPFVTTPEQHDRTAALISHLPQLIAVSLTQVAAQGAKKDKLASAWAAGGFRDLTRIASSPYAIWKDILKTNNAQVVHVLNTYIDVLRKLKLNVKNMKTKSYFKSAKQFRDALPRGSKGFLKNFCSVAVVIPDEVGSLAKICVTLSEHHLDIKDLELIKVREHDAGAFHFYFQDEANANKAHRILLKQGYASNIIPK